MPLSNLKTLIFTANTSWYIYNFQFENIQHLISLGYRVIVVAPLDAFSDKFSDNGVEYIEINISNHGLSPLKDWATCLQYISIYRKIRPHLVCSFTIKPNIYSTIAAGCLKIKVVNNVSGLGAAFMRKGVLSYVVVSLYRCAMRYSSHVFFQNDEDRQLFTSKITVAHTDLLPGSGVDTVKFSPCVQQKCNTIKFLLMARLLWAKGINEYVQAATVIKQQYPNVECYLLGESCEGRLCVPIQQIEEWQQLERINYLGFAEDVRSEIAKADCVVLPSYYAEGTPRSLLEAASMGKPVITTDANGCRNVVEDGVTGFLCRPRSVDDLVAKMALFIDLDTTAKLFMGVKAREKIMKEYDVAKVITKYKQKIAELL